MSPELRFVAACCRWPDDEGRRSLVQRLAADVGDWERVVALTAAHRVEGLVHHAVHSAGIDTPVGVAAQIAAMAEEVKRKSLQGVGEALRICGLLQAAAIDFRVIKGLPVAVIAYQTVTLKNSLDLDLLVHPQDVVSTVRLLEQTGYVQKRPWRPLDDEEFRSWSVVAKEAWFVGARGQVDLHWDLLDQPAVLAGLDPWADPQLVSLVGGSGVPTLPDAAHLAYLAAHGAMSGWSRLKWLADFAAFLSARMPEEQERLCRTARALTEPRVIDHGLILARELLGSPLPIPLPGQHDASEQLARIAIEVIQCREPGVAIETMWRPAHLISRMQWNLRSGVRFKVQEVRRRLLEQEIRLRLRRRPRAVSRWIYMALRMPGGLFRLIWQALRPHAAE